MKIVSTAEVVNKGKVYTIMLETGMYVDVKRTINDFYYIMDCGEGYMTFDDNGNTFDYHFDEKEVVEFVRKYDREDLNRYLISKRRI